MAKKAGIGYEDIVREVRGGDFRAIYYLMGEESYYIDRLAEYITDKALQPEERDFNLTILYGPQTNGQEVVSAAKRYPMMAERQVVVVREAQKLDGREALAYYAQQPLLSTVLIICHKGGTLDRRTKVATEIARAGVIFESHKLYDRELPAFVTSYVRRKGLEIDPAACQILCEYVGADLNRLASELDKLALALANDNKRIDAQAIQDNIGISKEYNSFELVEALTTKNILKANRIAKYFDSNPKNFALQPTLATIFKTFSDVLLAFYAPVRSDDGIAAWLGQPVWQVRRNISPAVSRYSAMKVFQIIDQIRRTDAASKGVGGIKATDGDLLKELIFFILH